MSEPLFSIVEGWTGPLPMTLSADGVPIDVTGLRVQGVIEDSVAGGALDAMRS